MKLLGTVESPQAVIVNHVYTQGRWRNARARDGGAARGPAGIQPRNPNTRRITLEIASALLEHQRRLGWQLLENPARMRNRNHRRFMRRHHAPHAVAGALRRDARDHRESAGAASRWAARNTLRHADSGDAALASVLLHLDNDFNQAERLIIDMLENAIVGCGTRAQHRCARSGVLTPAVDWRAAAQRCARCFDDDIAGGIASLLYGRVFPSRCSVTNCAALGPKSPIFCLLKTGSCGSAADRGRRQEALLGRLQNRKDLLRRAVSGSASACA